MADLNIFLREFLVFHNPESKEPKVASWKLVLKIEGLEQVSKDVQEVEIIILLLWQCCGLGI